ncbi:hypothetical protein O181_077767 [Austropuccinia psidii MF-1]|uniref:GAG-pre-integrase domain-containing protein n=1 Tax=Austropuccinia psidii MF-1 TaxID=1389203 RepID=A0A9Q3FJ85_9BASI|nr:hypothetical protein [Austropuccinia psidii MF-1]
MTPFVVATGDPSSTLHGEGIGLVNLRINGSMIKLKGCLYVPQISKNLISLLQIFDKDVTICKLPANLFEIICQDIRITRRIADRLMVIDCNPPQSNLTTSYLWNQRLGHPSNQALKTLGLPLLNYSCHICMSGKSTLLPFSGQFDKVNQLLECVHLDLVGPITPPLVAGHKYFLTIFDQFSSFKTVKFLKRKENCYDEFVNWKKFAVNLHEKKLKDLYLIKEASLKIKRANQTILEKAKCLMIGSSLPKQYWAEAINTAIFLSNHIPTLSRDNLSPFSLWSNKSSRIKRLETFGCKAVIIIPKHLRSWKFSPSGEDGILLGYQNENSAYQILRIRDRTIVITRHALFAENHFPSIDSNSDSHSNRWIDLCEEKDECIDPEEILTDQGLSEITESKECVQEQDEELIQNATPSNTPVRLKVVGPQHPTIINGDISHSNILPYSRRPKNFITVKDADPISY